MSKNILFSNTSWRSHLMRETAERKLADEFKEDKSNKVTSFQSTPDHEHYASEKLLFDSLLAISEKIAMEINRAYESENFIYNELLKEKSFAEDADAALQAAIEAEEQRAVTQENGIKERLDALQKFTEYKNLLLLNSLMLQGYSTIGSGVPVESAEILSGFYNMNGIFQNDASILTSLYDLSIGKAYKLNCQKLSDASLANILLFDCDGNIYPFNLELKNKIFIPDKSVTRIGLSYAEVSPLVELFGEEQVVATIANNSVTKEKLSDELLEEIENITRSVLTETSRATAAEE